MAVCYPDLAAHHRHRLDWVGLTLPGMMEEPGSLAGSASSPKPQRGPEPSHLMSLAIFISEAASVLSALRQPRWRRERQLGEFVLGRAEGQAGDVGDFIGHHLGKERVSIEARAHGGTAQREFKQVVERKVKAAKVGVELGDPAEAS